TRSHGSGIGGFQQDHDFHVEGELFLVVGSAAADGFEREILKAAVGEVIFEVGQEFADVVVIGGAADGNRYLVIGEIGEHRDLGNRREAELGHVHLVGRSIELLDVADEPIEEIAAGHGILYGGELVIGFLEGDFDLGGSAGDLLVLFNFLLGGIDFSRDVRQLGFLVANQPEPQHRDDHHRGQRDKDQLIAFVFGKLVHSQRTRSG